MESNQSKSKVKSQRTYTPEQTAAFYRKKYYGAVSTIRVLEEKLASRTPDRVDSLLTELKTKDELICSLNKKINELEHSLALAEKRPKSFFSRLFHRY